jgi:hypothetical protein
MYYQYTSSRYGQAKLASISIHFNFYRCVGIEWMDDFTAIGKNIFFLRNIVIFHTRYPKHFRASLRSAQFF